MLLCHDEQRFIVLDLMTYQLFLFCFLLLYMEIWCIIIKKKVHEFLHHEFNTPFNLDQSCNDRISTLLKQFQRILYNGNVKGRCI